MTALQLHYSILRVAIVVFSLTTHCFFVCTMYLYYVKQWYIFIARSNLFTIIYLPLKNTHSIKNDLVIYFARMPHFS